MRELLRLISWRGVAASPGRALLTTLALACGVALQVAIALINDATLTTVRRGFDALAGPTALSVVGPEAGFEEATLETVRAVPGVARALPVIEARGYFTGRDGRARSVVVLGLDLVEEAALGRAPAGETEVDPLLFLNEPEAVLLGAGFAAEEGLTPGGALVLATTSGQQELRVRGLLKPQGLANAFGGQVAIMDLEAARLVFGKEGRTDRLDVVLAPGATVDEVLPRLGAALGPGLRVERPAARGEVLARMVTGFQGLLSVVGLLALLVGVFVVSGTLGTVVAERRRTFGLLRAVGATRVQVLALVVVEAAVQGLVGGALGVGLGFALAQGLVRAVARAVAGAVMVPLVVREVSLSASAAVVGVALGTLAAVLGAARPAWQAWQARPVEALRPPERDPSLERSSRLGLLGVGLLAALAASSALGPAARSPVLEVVEVLLAVGGATLAMGFCVEWPLRLLRGLLARQGGRWIISARLAVEELARHPRRTTAAVRSLMLGLLPVVLVATMAGSFKHSVTSWFGNILRWDLLVTSRGSIVSGQLQPLQEDVGRELLTLPGVAPRVDGRAAALRLTSVRHQGRPLALKAYDRPQQDDEWAVFDLRGVAQREAGARLFDAPTPAVLVSENLAAKEHLRAGDVLTLDTPSGPTRFTVVGEVTDYASPEGVLYVDRAVYRRLWRDPLVSGFGLRLLPGVEARTVRAELEARFGAARGFTVSTNAEVRRETERTMDDAFSFTTALQAAALLVGLFGLLSTMTVAVLSRTREFGALRAIGQSRAQLMAQVLVEAAVQGLVGAGAAAVLGAYVAWAWLVGAVSRTMGLPVDFIFPGAVLGPTLGLGVLVGLAAGAWPAWRAGSLDIVEVISNE